MSARSCRSVQISNSPDGGYVVRLPLPYPYHVTPTGRVEGQEFWRGTPVALLGFQREANRQQVDLLTEDWWAGDPDAVIGWYAVFIDADGGMWNTGNPVDSVSVTP